jgi:CheY-like chemotaxis protein
MGQLTALLLSRDPEAQRMISSVLGKVGVYTETFPGPAPGLRALKTKKYEGVIVDCDDLDCGIDMLAMLRDQAFTKTTIVFALVNGMTSMHDAFGLGANFVLEKPLVNERVMRCFRAAQGLMVGERRRYYRHEADFPVYFDFPKHFADAPATLCDISMGGMLVRTSLALMPEMEGKFRFTLPDVKSALNGTCQVVWKSGECVGLRFVEMSRNQNQALENWLADRFAETHTNIAPLIPDAPDPARIN